MFALINVSCIFKKHFDTLKQDAKFNFILLIFVLIPTVLSLLLIWINKLLTETTVNTLITAFSIFTGLLLNVIFIIFDIAGKLVKDTSYPQKKKLLIEHLYANSLYALLISTIVLIILILATIIEIWKGSNLVLIIFSLVVYFSVGHFLMTLIMIIKRLFILLFTQLEDIEKTNKG